MTMLIRYWFTFGKEKQWIRYVGVTAYSLDDAKSLINAGGFYNSPMPDEFTVVENIDISTLDEGKILPNIGPPNFRGVWYPNLL